MDENITRIKVLETEILDLKKEINQRDTYIKEMNSSSSLSKIRLDEGKQQNIGIPKEDVMLALFGKKI